MEVDRHLLGLFRGEKLRADHFTTVDGACLLGKAGRACFYAEWEPLAERLRKRLAEAMADVGAVVGQAGALDAPAPHVAHTTHAAEAV